MSRQTLIGETPGSGECRSVNSPFQIHCTILDALREHSRLHRWIYGGDSDYADCMGSVSAGTGGVSVVSAIGVDSSIPAARRCRRSAIW